MKFRYFLIFPIILSSWTKAEIPEWYAKGVVKFVEDAEAVVMIKVISTELKESDRTYNYYQINSETIEVLKGNIVEKACYSIQSEGDFGNPEKYIGEERIVILRHVNREACSYIDNLMSTPATEEYVSYFKKIIKK